MSELLGSVSDSIKRGSTGFAIFTYRLLVAVFLSYCCALVGQTLWQFQAFSFVLIAVGTTAFFMKLLANWGVVGVTVFLLSSMLFGLLLRLYIVVAPG